MQSFADLFARRAAECCLEGTDKDTVHAYSPVYERLFARRRNDVRNVLEIGTCSGAGAEALAEYFPGARVASLDIAPDRRRFGHPRADFFVLDGTAQTTPEDLAEAGHDAFDAIIDDASHVPGDVFRSLDVFWGRLRPGGVYLIEDVNLTAHPALADELRERAESLGADCEVFDMRAETGRFDDVVVAIHKGVDGITGRSLR